MNTRLRAVLIGALLVSSSVLSAQGADSGRRAGAPRGRGGRGGQMQDGRPLERRVQQAIAQTVRRQLNLDDDKMRQLERASAKYENDRRELLGDERAARQTLRRALEDSASTDQSRIETALSRMIQVQRRRVDILEAEQKELATFLTAKQRAQYFALRERITRRLMEMEQSGPGRRGGPPPR